MAEEERFFTVDLTPAYDHIRTKRARRTVKLLREYIARNLKVTDENVKLSEKVNATLWQGSMQHPPRWIKIKVQKKDDKVNVRLPDEKEEEKKEEKKKEEKKPEAKKEPAKEEKPKGAPKEEKKTPEKPKEAPKEAAKEKPKEEKKHEGS